MIDTDRLLAQLNMTGLSSKNPPLYQVIKLLIQSIKELQTASSSSGGGGGGNTTTNIFNQVIQLINDSGDRYGGGDSLVIPGPPGATGSAGSAGAQGPIGPPGFNNDDCECDERIIMIPSNCPFVEWSVLTNGDPVSPEIIFDSNGDVIMTYTIT